MTYKFKGMFGELSDDTLEMLAMMMGVLTLEVGPDKAVLVLMHGIETMMSEEVRKEGERLYLEAKLAKS